MRPRAEMARNTPHHKLFIRPRRMDIHAIRRNTHHNVHHNIHRTIRRTPVGRPQAQ